MIAARLERAAMDLGRADAADDRAVRRRDVADVRVEAVGRIERVGGVHVAVARHLGDDRRGRDRRALLVAVDDRAVRRRGRPELEAVDSSTSVADSPPSAAHSPRRFVRCRPSRSITTDGERQHGDAPGTREHGSEEVLTGLVVELLRVVQERERTRAVVAHGVEVEQDARDDERPGERPAPRLVRSGDESAPPVNDRTRAALPAGQVRHPADNSVGRGERTPAQNSAPGS